MRYQWTPHGMYPTKVTFQILNSLKEITLLISYLKYQLASRLRHCKSCLMKGISIAYCQLLCHSHSEMKLPCGKVTVNHSLLSIFTHKRDF